MFKAAIVYPEDFSLWHFHSGLIRMLRAQGIEVHCICPPGDYVSKLESLGAVHVPIEFSRFVNPAGDLRYMLQLYRIFRRERYDYVHAFTVKPNVFATVAAALAGVPHRFMTLEGLGAYGSAGGGWRRMPLRAAIRVLYTISCALVHKAWFMNPDDLHAFRAKRIIAARKALLIRGAGVNMRDYSPAAVSETAVCELRRTLGLTERSQVVSLILARLIWTKGIAEYAEAARHLNSRFPDAVFVLVGRVEPDSLDAVPESYVQGLHCPYFKVMDFLPDVRPLIALSDAVVLPSYYGEGVPRILLEAMAMGKPVVTTDSVGCREVIEDGKNGFLVQPRDSGDLARAVAALLADPAASRALGAYGKRKAASEFADQGVHLKVQDQLYGFRCGPDTGVDEGAEAPHDDRLPAGSTHPA